MFSLIYYKLNSYTSFTRIHYSPVLLKPWDTNTKSSATAIRYIQNISSFSTVYEWSEAEDKFLFKLYFVAEIWRRNISYVFVQS